MFLINIFQIVSASEICVRLFGEDYNDALEALMDQVLSVLMLDFINEQIWITEESSKS